MFFFFCFFFFFFQAEDGIRDGTVTGVQTCALPIFFSLSLITDSAISFLPAWCTCASAGTDLACSASLAGGAVAAFFEDGSLAGATVEMQATSNTPSRLPIIHLCDGLSLPPTELTRPNATRN